MFWKSVVVTIALYTCHGSGDLLPPLCKVLLLRANLDHSANISVHVCGSVCVWVPIWKLPACSYAQDGGEVVFPNSGSVLLTFLQLEGVDLDIDVRVEETKLLYHFAQ